MKTLIDLFFQFSKLGEKPVFVYRTGIRRFVFIYKELYFFSLKAGAWLKNNGIQKGDRVVLWAPNSPWWGVVFWGAILRGAIVVPVDFMSGKERAQKIADLVDAKLIIQSQYKVDGFNKKSGAIFFIEDLESTLQNFEALKDLPKIEPDDIAEIIYTSGTTGDPKGVVLTHKNLVANLLAANDRIKVDEDYNFLSLLPLSHMFEQMGGFFTPLYRGGKVIYLRTLKPLAIMEALHNEDIYAMIIVPRLLLALKASIEREFSARHLGLVFRIMKTLAKNWPMSLRRVVFYPVHKKFGSNFKFFVSGGAALDLEVVKFWDELGFRVVEGYGLTECSPVLTLGEENRRNFGSVGRVLKGIQLKINQGEILAKGENVFSGYYKNEKATREVFTKDGWFRTGDLGLIDEAGNLRLKGRRKEVIVTGAGINVYPDDIEPILNKTRGVKEACVLGIDRGEGEEVCAVLILDENSRKPEEIIKEVNLKLDSLQQITEFRIWPEAEFPKTTTLKIQKFLVKEKISKSAKDSKVLLVDKLIYLISRVTSRSLEEIKEDSVLVSDLGLTSIARLELVNYLEQEFRIDLDDTLINQNTKVVDLREMIKRRERKIERLKYRTWIHTSFGRALQRIFDSILHWPVFGLIVKVKIEGIENIKKIKGPVIFIANHASFLDGPSVYASLPRRWRYHLASAATEELFFMPDFGFWRKIFGRLFFEYMVFLCGAFTVTQDSAFRKSLVFMGKLIDRGVNILIFPEGERSWDNKLLPFAQGLGIMVKELKVAVVPIKIIGAYELLPRGSSKIKRGDVVVRYGAPIIFTNESLSQIVEISEKAVRNL